MNIKRTELYIFAGCIIALIIRLYNTAFIDFFIYAFLLALVGIWFYGFAGREQVGKSGYTGLELAERVCAMLLILGIMLNVTENKYSCNLILLGFLIYLLFHSSKVLLH